VVLDKNENVGDNWKLRYGSARCKCSCLLEHDLVLTLNSAYKSGIW
jgi:hypothetical protein